MNALTALDMPRARPQEHSLIRSLPEDLRTNHWYCDLHHSMFLIILASTEQAVMEDRTKTVEYFIDTLTIYWLVHSLMEEEGMAFGLPTGLDQDVVSRHTRAHVMLTKWWYGNVLTPFKEGGADRAFLRQTIHKFYGMVVNHISEMDQATFGTDSGRSTRSIQQEIAHLADSGLPLSPHMHGCADIMSLLAPRMSKSLSARALTDSAKTPLGQLNLATYSDKLWTGGKGAFRDIFLDRYRELSHKIRTTGRVPLACQHAA